MNPGRMSPVINVISGFSNTNNNIDCQYLNYFPKILHISLSQSHYPRIVIQYQRSHNWPHPVSKGDTFAY